MHAMFAHDLPGRSSKPGCKKKGLLVDLSHMFSFKKDYLYVPGLDRATETSKNTGLV